MKTRFTTIDILSSITELKARLQGMRVQQVYDIDNKTYLIKLSKQDSKAVLLLESGNRIHSTEFEWPKNPAPSGFSMKLRKHLKSRRFENINLLGIDRIVDIQFGSSEAAYHVILELYDRGNICLTDHEYTILNLLRVRTDESQDVKLFVREKYPIANARQQEDMISHNRMTEILENAKTSESLKRILNPLLVYGPALIGHVLLEAGFSENVKISELNIASDVPKIIQALEKAEVFMKNHQENLAKGYIIQKREKRIGESESSELVTYQEFHPYLFHQFKDASYVEFDSFDKAVDEFFSKLEGQKLDMKTVQQERSAMKKLDNVRKDHVKRVGELQKVQESDKTKAELIEMNLEIVERALLIIRSAIANQIDWQDIESIIQDAKSQNDPIAKAIKTLKLDKNCFVMLLGDPYDKNSENGSSLSSLVEIDLDLSAYANARRYFDQKKHASRKEQKTLEASKKALKSAEKKTKQTLKEVSVAATINKARKTFWFEKFLWFVSSENYLVIGGRDQQQNEMIVKKYMRSGDAYVHADLHGASSIIVKNSSGGLIPPKTLNEAGTMAVCSSAAWEAKVVTSAWWVHANQVSKTAPSGEYLTTGSFMIRGKKNYLPPCHLIMGFGFLFKLDEEFVERHQNERKVRVAELQDAVKEDESEPNVETEEIPLDEDNSSDDEKEETAAEENELATKENVENEEAIKESDESENEISAFPDTQVTLQHVSGDQFQIHVDKTQDEHAEDKSDRKIVFLGDEKPVVIKSPRKAKNKMSAKATAESIAENQACNSESKQNELKNTAKRGQKAKMKRIKQKYKDQDEEEKELRMKILASAGKEKESKKKKDLRMEKKSKQNQRKTASTPAAVILHEEDFTQNDAVVDKDQEESDEEDKNQKDETVKVLDSLTGCPFPDDGLLFAIPICAPYATLQNYKFKVKMTPGTGKRGKAAKTALQIFLKSKEVTPREKDLLKTVKDQDISRNLPGKVKLSATQSAIQKTK